MTRDEAARAFAEKTGLTLEGCGGMGFGTKWGFARRGSIKVTEFFDFPAPDAPLHEHLAFVGRVAVAIWAIQFNVHWVKDMGQAVEMNARQGTAPDISHAALLAALAALEGR